MKPRWSVVAVVSRGDEILAVARKFDPKDVNLPGGHDREEDLNPPHTLRRVVLEETGVRVRQYHLMTSWQGDMGQPVYAYFVSTFGGRARSSTSGKTLWAKPAQLVKDGSTFQVFNKQLLKTLMRVS